MKSISTGQCRAARGLIGLSQKELAQVAGISERTLADFERGTRNPHPSTLTVLRAALEAAGVVFIDDDPAGDGPGVRLRREEI